MQRMIELSRCVRELHHRVRLNAGFQSDSGGGNASYPFGMGLALWKALCMGVSRKVLTSDASGSWGCGAFTSDGQWFQLQLPACWDGVQIAVKELRPFVLGVAI